MDNTVTSDKLDTETIGMHESPIRTAIGADGADGARLLQTHDLYTNDEDGNQPSSDTVHIEMASNSFANVASLLASISHNSSLAFHKSPFVQIALAEHAENKQAQIYEADENVANESGKHPVVYVQQNGATATLTPGYETGRSDDSARRRNASESDIGRVDVERALSNIPAPQYSVDGDAQASILAPNILNFPGNNTGTSASDNHHPASILAPSTDENFSDGMNPFATDADTVHTLTFHIAGGADAALFAIDNSGNLSFVSSTNSEVSLDIGASNTYHVVIGVSDGNNNLTQAISVIIPSANQAPTVANPLADQNATEDASFDFTVPGNTFVDDDSGDTLTYTATLENGDPLPNWLHFETNDLSFSGTPDSGDVGHINVIIIATDESGASTSDIFTITVGNINDAPTGSVTIDDTTPAQGQTLSAANTLGDLDGMGAITYTWTDGSGNTLGTGSTYTTTQADVGDTVTVTATYTDAQGHAESVSSTATAAVANVNDPTILGGAISGTGNEDTAITGTLTASDADGLTDGTYFTVTGAAGHGTASIDAATGAWSYTPTANYNGADSFTVTVTDDAGNATTQVISLTVNPVNDAPVINSNGGGDTASVNVAENSVAVTTVIATDVDAGSSLTYSIVADGDGALFSINSSTGVLTFKSAPNYEAPADSGGNNVYDVTVQVSDGTLSDTQKIAVTVTDVSEVNAPPVAASNSISIAEASQNTALGLTAPTDVDSGSLTITVTGLPTLGAVTLADGTALINGQTLTSAQLTSLQYDAPAASTYNNQTVGSFAYTVSDGTNTVTGGTTITVSDSSEVSATADTATAVEGYWTSTGSSTTTLLYATDWSSGTSSGGANNINMSGDPTYGGGAVVLKTINSSNTPAPVFLQADADHAATITFRLDVKGYSSTDVVKYELVNKDTGEIAQTKYWTTVGSFDDQYLTFTGVTETANYYIQVSATDNTNNGSDSAHDLYITIDEITSWTYYKGTTQTTKIDAPGTSWTAATNATGNVTTNDSKGSEGATVTAVSSAVDSSSNLAADADIAGNYGLLHIAADGAYTYTPTSDDYPAGASDIFTYTLAQADGDATTATLTVNLTNHTYGGTYTAGNDTINGAANEDTLYGGDGNDTLHGSGGNDILMGGTGIDILYGDAGQDRLIGGTGDDYLYAGTSNSISDNTETTSNLLEGGAGNDTLYGSGGSDYLMGGSDNDILVGNAGDDILAGGLGNDNLTGGAGSDVFKYSLGDLSAGSTDTITDFKVDTYANDGDILDISDVLQGAHPTDAATLISGGYLTFGAIANPSGTATFTLSIDPDGSAGSSYGSMPLANFTMTGVSGLTTGAQILQKLLDNGELLH